jgi:hypothetical protein
MLAILAFTVETLLVMVPRKVVAEVPKAAPPNSAAPPTQQACTQGQWCHVTQG